MPKLLLAGYFGCGNLGDDAILLGLLEGLKGSDIEVSALTGFPNETYSRYGIHSLPRKDFKAIDAAIKSCDALVFPGGSIFQDTTSVRSVAYYSNLVQRAKKAKKKVVLLGQGVGPVNTFLGKKLTSAAYNAADAIAVRDPDSVKTLQSLGVKKKIFVTADTAYLLTTRPGDHTKDSFNLSGMKTVGLAPRPFGKGNDVVELFGGVARMLYQANVMPVLIQMDREEDGALLLEIQKAQGGKIPDLKKVESPADLQLHLMRMEGLIAMRLHAGILAAKSGVPPLMLNYDPKVAAFAKLLDVGQAMNLNGLTAERVFDRFREHQAQAERNKKILALKTEELTAKARQNIDILLETLNRAPSKV